MVVQFHLSVGVLSHGSIVLSYGRRVLSHGSTVLSYGSRVLSHGSRLVQFYPTV